MTNPILNISYPQLFTLSFFSLCKASDKAENTIYHKGTMLGRFTKLIGGECMHCKMKEYFDLKLGDEITYDMQL